MDADAHDRLCSRQTLANAVVSLFLYMYQKSTGVIESAQITAAHSVERGSCLPRLASCSLCLSAVTCCRTLPAPSRFGFGYRDRRIKTTRGDTIYMQNAIGGSLRDIQYHCVGSGDMISCAVPVDGLSFPEVVGQSTLLLFGLQAVAIFLLGMGATLSSFGWH